MPSRHPRPASGSSQRLSPGRTRRATFGERLTVRRLSWETIVRLNAWLELAGRIAAALWGASLVSLVVGIDWESFVEDAINSGRPVERALLLAIVLATVTFLLARSLLIAARWRLQRELWRHRARSAPRSRGWRSARPASPRRAGAGRPPGARRARAQPGQRARHAGDPGAPWLHSATPGDPRAWPDARAAHRRARGRGCRPRPRRSRLLLAGSRRRSARR